jgi:hypothetical protein
MDRKVPVHKSFRGVARKPHRMPGAPVTLPCHSEKLEGAAEGHAQVFTLLTAPVPFISPNLQQQSRGVFSF